MLWGGLVVIAAGEEDAACGEGVDECAAHGFVALFDAEDFTAFGSGEGRGVADDEVEAVGFLLVHVLDGVFFALADHVEAVDGLVVL